MKNIKQLIAEAQNDLTKKHLKAQNSINRFSLNSRSSSYQPNHYRASGKYGDYQLLGFLSDKQTETELSIKAQLEKQKTLIAQKEEKHLLRIIEHGNAVARLDEYLKQLKNGLC